MNEVPWQCKNFSVGEKYELAYQGWPFRILCNAFLDLDDKFSEDFLEQGLSGKKLKVCDNDCIRLVGRSNIMFRVLLQCIVLDGTGSVLYQKTFEYKNLLLSLIGYVTDDINSSPPPNYTLVIEVSRWMTSSHLLQQHCRL